MAHYSSIRGWLQVSSIMVVQIREMIPTFKARAKEYDLSLEDADLYLGGFLFQEKRINWSDYVFYGADVRTSAVHFIEDLIKEIGVTVNEKDGNYIDRPFGLFYINDEDEENMIQWLIAHGEFKKQVMDYLFAERH